MPEVSVIVPIYNSEDYLEACLDSLVVQSFRDLEILLIDDGSQDASREICMEYCARFPAFRYFRKGNGGLSDARHFGIAKAKGRWLAFVDSDDYVERDFIRMLYAAAAKATTALTVQMTTICTTLLRSRSTYSRMLTPAGTKKKAMFARRKSDFSRMCSTRSRFVHRSRNSRTIPRTLAGNGMGSRVSTSWLTQHTANRMPT